MAKVDRLVTFLVLAFPVVLLAVKPLAIILFALLVVVGMFISVKYGKNPFAIKSIKTFSWLTVGYFAVMAFSVMLSNEPTNSWVHLGRISYFLVAPFVALAVAKASVSIEELAKSFKIGVIVAGVISITGFILSDGVGRFSGMYNPNTFGDLAVLMLIFAISLVNSESLKSYYLSLCAAIFGVMAIVASGSRGSMIGLMFLMMLLYYFQLIFKHARYKRIILLIVLSLSVFVFSVVVLTKSSDRLFSVGSQIQQWKNGDLSVANTSGTRLTMYVAGWKAFLDSPVIGYGYHNCGIVAAKYASQDEITQRDYQGRWHLHNELITTIVNAGTLGFGALATLYMMPLLLFIRRKQNLYALWGILLIAGYIVLGTTHTLFGYEYETAFFVLMLAFLLQKVTGKKSHAK